MKDVNYLLKSSLYEIHLWGAPEQHPMKRMFLTRGAGILCLPLESLNLAASIVKLTSTFLPRAEYLKPKQIKVFSNATQTASNSKENPQKAFKNVLKEITGLTSTFFLGVIFSPELNFRLHNSLTTTL